MNSNQNLPNEPLKPNPANKPLEKKSQEKFKNQIDIDADRHPEEQIPPNEFPDENVNESNPKESPQYN